MPPRPQLWPPELRNPEGGVELGVSSGRGGLGWVPAWADPTTRGQQSPGGNAARPPSAPRPRLKRLCCLNKREREPKGKGPGNSDCDLCLGTGDLCGPGAGSAAPEEASGCGAGPGAHRGERTAFLCRARWRRQRLLADRPAPCARDSGVRRALAESPRCPGRVVPRGHRPCRSRDLAQTRAPDLAGSVRSRSSGPARCSSGWGPGRGSGFAPPAPPPPFSRPEQSGCGGRAEASGATRHVRPRPGWRGAPRAGVAGWGSGGGLRPQATRNWGLRRAPSCPCSRGQDLPARSRLRNWTGGARGVGRKGCWGGAADRRALGRGLQPGRPVEEPVGAGRGGPLLGVRCLLPSPWPEGGGTEPTLCPHASPPSPR